VLPPGNPPGLAWPCRFYPDIEQFKPPVAGPEQLLARTALRTSEQALLTRNGARGICQTIPEATLSGGATQLKR
jgi:hypothetical protein